MDQITSSYTSSSSSSSSSSIDNHPPKIIKSTTPSYMDSLHSVRKSIHKLPITKQFIAPLPPTPAKVYNVESSNFKEAVRMLTSAPEFQSPSVRRLKDIAPPPLTLSKIPKPSLFQQPAPPVQSSEGGEIEGSWSAFSILSPDFCKFLNETLETSRFNTKSPAAVMDYFSGLSPLGLTAPRAYDPFGVALLSPLGFGLSPSSLSWCSSALLSPTTLSGFNQSPRRLAS